LDEEWTRTQQDYVTWELAMIVVIKRTGAFAVYTATVEGGEGLLLFQSHLDAQAYREDSGLFVGYGVVGVDEPRIAGLLARYGLRWVHLADPWHESEGLVVTPFEGDTGSSRCWRRRSSTR
jgi:hypothetical protein